MMPSAKAPWSLPSAAFTASTGASPFLHLVGDEMDDGFGVGVGLELVAALRKLGLELAIVLDDAVVHDRDLGAHVRMRVALGRPTVRRPARVADAGVPRRAARVRGGSRDCVSLPSARRRSRCPFSTVATPARVVAAILEAPQRVDEIGRDGLRAQNADDATHAVRSSRAAALHLRSVQRASEPNHRMFRFLTLHLNSPSPCACAISGAELRRPLRPLLLGAALERQRIRLRRPW